MSKKEYCYNVLIIVSLSRMNVNARIVLLNTTRMKMINYVILVQFNVKLVQISQLVKVAFLILFILKIHIVKNAKHLV